MTDPDTDDRTEALLRETLRRHEQPADGAAGRLLPAVRAGLSERRPARGAWIAVAAAVVIAAGAVPAAFALLGGDAGEPIRVGATPPVRAPIDAPPEGWRWESSLGLMATVPEAWTINDYGCNQTAVPTVARLFGAQELCYTPEPANKEVVAFHWWGTTFSSDAVFNQALIDPATPQESIVVDGYEAVRVSTQLADGRHAAVVLVPDRGAALIVRTLTRETTDTIVDSLRIVDVDNVGCPTTRPEVTAQNRTAATFVDPEPASIGVCYYGSHDIEDVPGRLLVSAQLAGDAATDLAALINAAPAGGNPDTPADQCIPSPGEPDAVLQVVSADGTVARIWVSFSECVDRGLSDGTDTVQVNRRIVAAIMAPLHIGYGFSGDLPA